MISQNLLGDNVARHQPADDWRAGHRQVPRCRTAFTQVYGAPGISACSVALGTSSMKEALTSCAPDFQDGDVRLQFAGSDAVLKDEELEGTFGACVADTLPDERGGQPQAEHAESVE